MIFNNYWNELTLLDSNFGIIPAVCAFCKIISCVSKSYTIKDILTDTRRLMATQEAFYEIDNKHKSCVDINNYTFPEYFFLENSLHDRLPFKFTSDILSDLKWIAKAFDNQLRINSYSIEKNETMINSNFFQKEIEEIILNFLNNPHVYCPLLKGTYLKNNQNIALSKQIECTADIIQRLRDIPEIIKNMKKPLTTKASLFSNGINFALAGVIRTRNKEKSSPSAIYILSPYTYYGSISKNRFTQLRNLNIEIRSFVKEIVGNPNSPLNGIICNFIGQECHFKSIVMAPKWTIGSPNTLIALHIFCQDTSYLSNTRQIIPIKNLLEYLDEIKWDRWLQEKNDYTTIKCNNHQKINAIGNT